MEKNWAGPFFTHPDYWKYQPYPVMNMQTTFAFQGVGKNCAGPFFPHPDKIKHQPCAGGYLGGEKLGWSILFPTLTSEIINLTLSWIHYNLCFSGGGEKLGWPILSPPWQDKASALFRWLSGWRKTRLVHSFPTLRSKSINLNLSWI